MPFTCYIIGDTPLVALCAEAARQRGHTVLGVVSESVEVRRWAEERGIEALCLQAQLEELLSARPFDYLFSVGNLHLLPPGVLALPRRHAVNFHDGPLPRYAGLHATSWALMNGEKEHAVTWHLMTGEPDEGDILVRADVEIEEGETAFSLNLKCFEAGVASFGDLVEGLESGTLGEQSQDLSERTYFGRWQRPEAAAVIDWRRPAIEIDALVRALEFGHHPNPLGRAKIAVGDSFVLCPQVASLAGNVRSEPGRITLVEPERIVVAAGEGQVVLRRLLTPNGMALPMADAAALYHLREGGQLPLLDQVTRSAITKDHEDRCRHEAYWVDRLRDLHPPAIPFLRKGGKPGSPRATLDLALPDGGGPCEGPARGELVAAAFAAYIGRLSGQDGFDIGLLAHEPVESTSGLFAGWLPVRVDLPPARSAEDTSRQTVERFDEAREHGTFLRDLPARYPALAGLASAGPEERLPVGVAFIDEPVGSLHGPAEQIPLEGIPICLVLRGDGQAARLLYDGAVLTDKAADLMAGQFTTFLAAAIATPGRPVAELPLHSPGSLDALLCAWNNTSTPLPDGLCVHAAFEQQARRTPSAAALVCGDETLAYATLDERANRLAHYLQKLGAGPDRPVGISMARSSDLVVAVLAVLKAGAAYLPLDPGYPGERLRFMLEDSGASLLITEEGPVGAIRRTEVPEVARPSPKASADPFERAAPPSASVKPGLPAGLPHRAASPSTPWASEGAPHVRSGAKRSQAIPKRPDSGVGQGKSAMRIVYLDTDAEAIAGESPEAVDATAGPGNLAYVIYTSGSTGRPKGVMVEHRNVINLFEGMDGCIEGGERQTWLAVTSLSFDISVLELLWTLSRGHRVVLYNGDDRKPDVEHSIPELIRQHGVTHLQCTPSQARILLMSDDGESALARLDGLLVGGEALPADLAGCLASIVDGNVTNMYGPTETTVWSMAWQVGPEAARVLIGRPLANTRVFIVNERREHVPVGAVGELLIGGEGVARGYLNRPELTKERFFPDPFDGDAAGRLYRTGDLARFLEDGAVEFLGRVDQQVKIRGHRIEPGEVENVLLERPDVREAAVTAADDGSSGPRLVAHVVPAEGARCDGPALRAFLKERVPDFMVPVKVNTLAALPRTPNYKVDRKALQRAASRGAGSPATAPEGEGDVLVCALRALWAETLGVEEVGCNDSFFELGGHSLNAFEMTLGIRRACGVELPLEAIFSAPTPEGMAARLRPLFEEKLERKTSSSRCPAFAPDPPVAGAPAGKQVSGMRPAPGIAGHQYKGDAPSSDMERRLAAIWQRVLGVERIERDDDFFALGGTSLLAVRVFVEIEEQFGCRLPLSTLYHAPTLPQLAGQVEAGTGGTSNLWSCLVPIQPEGTHLPFFCVHCSKGNVLRFRDLAHKLGDDIPFYGVQCRGLEDTSQALDRLEDMASLYLEEIRDLQSAGPYCLGGFCMGGTIAYEMAQQLRRDGQEVGLVAMIDAVNSSRIPHPGPIQRKLEHLIDNAHFHCSNLARRSLRGRVRYLGEKVGGVCRRWAEPLRARVRNRRNGHAGGTGMDHTLEALEEINVQIDKDYEPEPYEGEVVLFRPTRPGNLRLRDPEMGWGGLATGGVKVITLPFNNARGMFVEPCVDELARELRRAMVDG